MGGQWRVPIPTSDGLLNPTLAALRGLGGVAGIDDIDARVAQDLGLTEDEMSERHVDGTSKARYRLRWARNYLKRYGLIRKEGGGVWSLTDNGKSTAVVDGAAVQRAIRNRKRKRPESHPDDAVIVDQSPPDEHEEDDIASASIDTAMTAVGVPAADNPATGAASLSFLDAAERVLVQSGDKKPMHYRAITQQALAQGLVRTAGKTPEATLYAQILGEVERLTRRGETPRFIKVGKGLVGLTRWVDQGPVAVIEQHNAAVRRHLRERLAAMSPDEFEVLVSRLLVAIGFEDVVVTARSNDGGIDVRGTLVIADVIRTRMAIQVKKWAKKNVQRPTVQQVRGSLGTHDQGLVITTSDFSAGAREEAARTDAVPVGLMNGEQLIASLVEHNLGVRRVPHDVLELGAVEPE